MELPRYKTFCFLWSLDKGAKIGAVILSLIWIFYVIFISIKSTDYLAWNIIWSLVNISTNGSVIYGLIKKQPKYLIPGLVMGGFNVVAGIITAIFSFVNVEASLYKWV